MEYSILKLNKKSNIATVKRLDWKVFISRIKNPIEGSKDTRSLIRFGLVRNTNPNVSKELISWTTYLILDYDEGVSIEEFKNKFKDVSYLLYTSYSHSLLKNKFKVIIKPKTPIHSSWLTNKYYVEYLVNKFSVGKGKPDVTCFNNVQFQLLPTKTKFYEYAIHKWSKNIPIEIKTIQEFNVSESDRYKILENKDNILSCEEQSEMMVTKTGCKVTYVSVEEASKTLKEELDRIKSLPRLTKKKKEEIRKDIKNKTSVKKWLNTEYTNKFEAIQILASGIIHSRKEYLDTDINSLWVKKYGVDINDKWKGKLSNAIKAFKG